MAGWRYDIEILRETDCWQDETPPGSVSVCIRPHPQRPAQLARRTCELRAPQGPQVKNRFVH